MHPSLCNLFLPSPHHHTTSKQTPVQVGTRSSWRGNTLRCATCTQLSVYEYLKDSFLSSAFAGVPPRRVDLVGLYGFRTLLSARPTNSPSTHSLSVVTLCTPHSTAHHPIALRDELDRLPILLTPLSFYFILQHYCTKYFPLFLPEFICGQSASRFTSSLRVESIVFSSSLPPSLAYRQCCIISLESPYNCRLITARA